MSIFLKLVKIYIASVFNFDNFKTQISKRKIKDGVTVNKISAFKLTGIIILFLLLFAEFLFIFGIAAFNLYNTAKALNNMYLLFEVSAVMISFSCLFFGIMLTSSTYYIGEIEQQFLSMPISPKTLFSAKFTANVINSLLTSVLFFIVLAVIYGINESPSPLFYVYLLICSILIPLPMISLCYFITILLMYFTRIFKNKNLIALINSLLGVAIALGFNYLIQSSLNNSFDNISQLIIEKAIPLKNYAVYYPPIKLIGIILADSINFRSLVFLFLLIAFSVAIPALIIMLLSNLYAQSLIGFNEKKLKKLKAKQISSFLKKHTKCMPPIFTYVKREINMMNRNPVFFLNGPFAIILFPIMIIVIIAARGASLQSVPLSLMHIMQSNTGFVITGLAAAFLGSMTNIADTAFSRDSKFIPFIKSLPVNIPQFMYAKLIHAMLFAFAAILMVVGFTTFVFKLGFRQIVYSVIIALSFSILMNLIALFLDTAHPKLHWDNPIAAMKQNMNVLFVTFFNMIIFAICAFILFLSQNAHAWVLLIYFAGVPMSCAAILIKPYGVYAEKKISELEL